MQRDIQAAADAGPAEESLCETAQIGDQTIEGIVFGVYGPNDLVHGASQFARGAVDLVGIQSGLLMILQFTAHSLAQHGNAGQAGAEVIMDVTSDASPLALEGLLPFQLLQPRSDATTRYPSRRASHSAGPG